MISTTKLTGRTICAAFRKYLQHRAKVKAAKASKKELPTRGKQSVEELIGQGQGAQQMDIAQTGIKDFERTLKTYGVDYAIRKDVTVQPNRYMVFFKAKDADVLTAAFKEYATNLTRKEKRPSVLKVLRKLKAKARPAPEKIREKSQELER
ncbi:MAG: PcfB family protein [Subdoligranulum sp.]|jgi:hypothetical protein